MSTSSPVNPVVLVILDGWGERDEADGNAIAAAQTPVFDALKASYPFTRIQTSGKAVGLPRGQMGNSEVGHLNIGAGRIVPQELVRISDAVEDGSLLTNPALVELCRTIRARKGKLHAVGLVSDGGVHSHIEHLFGLLDLAKQQGCDNLYIHAFSDGRDTPPTSGIAYFGQLQERIAQVGIGTIATLGGRYFGMDRDRRWDRIAQAYRVMTETGEGTGKSAVQTLSESYEAGITDEFIVPVRLAAGAIEPGDGLIFFNFRPDRARQLTRAFLQPDFEGFVRPYLDPLGFVSFTQYDATLPTAVAFPPQSLDNLLGQVIARQGLRQFRIAETEKYAHVTYFFNGGIEAALPGEDRLMVQSPLVPTYDLKPQMAALEVTTQAVSAITSRQYALVVINYANPDMVGHTGNFQAAIQAVQTVDTCLGRLLTACVAAGGTLLVTADHGNAELMWDEQGRPWTAHTTNPVPFILIESEGLKIPGWGTAVALREGGNLGDIAPTILDLLGIAQPPEMTGRSLLQKSDIEIRQGRSPLRVGI
ncbi:2,3-bisphosphoglycerate-independent phosphoglycerate mutase [Gloeobacter kilaueensis]|uniref:2,3-bisphosphoglycerate-independent phosphoglycerate mutase n=1 Tax=Gloeobacter kilaueensis (strain ATCC BAA-2537 / CCAP 1431/1 / ULC 316 / JS1) TaxID=1183438 RepID=U5QHH9_GLOK1|nr:2,3-bisphosphoglycerate-independent phosphoglycerate mutase [Gloeobacter kilaueensis]AGY58318.1 phosphoglyceromutase [Gloeobacter kilaueensis JS1]